MTRTLLESLREHTGETFEAIGLAANVTAGSVAMSASLVAYLAIDRHAGERLALEAARLAWAARAGVPVPTIVDFDSQRRWLVVTRAPDDDILGPRYVDAALAAATTLSQATEPLPAGAPRDRRAGRRSLLARMARMTGSPLNLMEFTRVRAEAAEFPRDTTVHGDFHQGNVLSDGGTAVTVVDFEFVGPGSAGSDIADLWTDLPDVHDRERLLEGGLAAMPGREEQLLTLLHWSTLRHLADLVSGVPRRNWDRPQIDQARGRVAEIRELRFGRAGRAGVGH